VQHVVSLGIILITGNQVLDHEDMSQDDMRHNTFAAVIDAHSGALRMMDTVDSDVQGSAFVAISLSIDCHKCSLITVRDSGDVNIIGLRKFMESGFERDGFCLQTSKVFPEYVITVDATERYIVAVAGAGKERMESECSSYEKIPAEDATVLMAGWSSIT
jgi:hypothetical protein